MSRLEPVDISVALVLVLQDFTGRHHLLLTCILLITHSLL
jgi:hypothetical protein